MITAVLAAATVTPPFAVAKDVISTDAVAAYDAVLSKDGDDDDDDSGQGRGRGRGRGGENGNGNGNGNGGRPVPEAPAPPPVVEAPRATPTPRVEVRPAPTAAPKPPPRAQAPKPTPTQSPRPAPTQSPRPAPTQAPKPAPAATPKPRPAPTAAPKPRPAPTPGRSSTPTPAPPRDDRASGESGEDRTGIGIPVAPGGGGSGPAIPVLPGATPGNATPAPSGGNGRGGRVTAPRVTGGLVDMADRSPGTGGRSRARTGGGSAPAGNGGSSAAAPVVYRQDPRSGRRVYAVPTPDGRAAREVAVPGGVFGILPAAAIEADAEVRGAVAEGGSRGSLANAEAESSGSRGVAQTISGPLEAIDDVTGGSIPPALVLAGLAAMALLLGFGIRRELHRS